MDVKYYVILKDVTFGIEIAEKIRAIEKLTPEERYKIKEKVIETYESGTQEKCKNFIENLDDDLKALFYIIKE